MDGYDERVCLNALNKIFGNVPIAGRMLIEHFGCASDIFYKADDAEIRDVLGKNAVLADEINSLALAASFDELGKLRENGQLFIAYNDEEYPSSLAECPDCPLGLYVNPGGPLTAIFDLRPMVAIVGTRNISPYGKEWCARLVKAMSETSYPPQIVSGLAYGADAVAHESALTFGLGTVGVMATGLDKIYPNAHEYLASRIVASPLGALVSDYPYGTSPLALNFLRRNRIIAGLCQAVIVIESMKKGGSLVTARYAVEYDRELYALPGRIDDIRSSGCNSLISSKMAELITSPDDLVDSLGLGGVKSSRRVDFAAAIRRKYGEGSAPEKVALLIRSNRGIDYDGLCHMSGLCWTEVSQAVALLEADGVITTDFLQRCAVRVF